jgi:hypothetical protein
MLSTGTAFQKDQKWGYRNGNNNVGYKGKAQFMADVNGDGKADYVYNRDNTHEYWVMLSTGTAFKTDQKWGYRNGNNNVGFDGDAEWMADVNGDGKADYVYNRDKTHEYWVMLSTGTRFKRDTYWGALHHRVGFSGTAQWLADMNGDKKADFFYNRGGMLAVENHQYWVMQSNGTQFLPDERWGSRNINNNVGWNGKGQFVVDFNGDGKCDYVYNRDKTPEYWGMISIMKKIIIDKSK